MDQIQYRHFPSWTFHVAHIRKCFLTKCFLFSLPLRKNARRASSAPLSSSVNLKSTTGREKPNECIDICNESAYLPFNVWSSISFVQSKRHLATRHDWLLARQPFPNWRRHITHFFDDEWPVICQQSFHPLQIVLTSHL